MIEPRTSTGGPADRSAPDVADGVVLVPGETCWRIERAARYAVFVDAADYFAVLKKAVLAAQRRVLFIGWDFDPRIRLDPRSPGRGRDDRLGRVLETAVRDNPQLEIGVLQWGMGAVESLRRGVLPAALVMRRAPERLEFFGDHHHPVGAAHHQKIVVIDDCLAFAGGIDVTADRWDTSEHLDRHPLRHRPTSRRSTGPWHDVTTLVSGPAARALGDLARERWESGTGSRLEPVEEVEPCWPDGVEPLLGDVDVAISRTRPEHGGTELVHEIELLWLAAIAAAREVVYIENQYFANRRIAEAIADRLGEDDGPEFIVVNPESAVGWLEEKAMGTARARLLDVVRKADVHGRFRIYVPVTDGGRPVYVHAKVLVLDDRLLRIGSANLNNRSMGLDSECDLTIEVREEDARRAELTEAVLGMRHRLLGEHLGVEPSAVAAAVREHDGSLIRAVESLRNRTGRTLQPFEPPRQHVVDRALAETELLDAERTPDRWGRIKGSFRRRR
ncbi:phospholipase D-like domain-containing protein [Blastococcus goldschmidtiae]|uniref:Phospholipase D-like domain-containing protein n=1 Tax=Blastococcus goldschmidtiae TaxID=3075546 RepID=A0ABU2K8V7_9ACTN|nr:phospholipase D-like domain-containing protein [Blastococcus sp. DSM 46792]MDT0276622.1 phospholipase D-like domain-containing protein [Blastococcus sp. DSM 46792]